MTRWLGLFAAAFACSDPEPLAQAEARSTLATVAVSAERAHALRSVGPPVAHLRKTDQVASDVGEVGFAEVRGRPAPSASLWCRLPSRMLVADAGRASWFGPG